MSGDQGKGGSVLYGISMNNKGKFVWTESYQSLQTFVEEVLNLSKGTWTCPGGDAKQFKADDIDIRWYPDTRTITLNGKLKDEIKEKLLSIASIQRDLANTVNEDIEQNGHICENTNHSSQQDNSSLSLESLNRQLEAITKDVNANSAAVKLFIEHANAHNMEIDDLKKENLKLKNENLDLKSENDSLKERVNHLSYSLADLQGKAKNAEDEKDSLIVAMRLLFEDLNHNGNEINANRNEKIEQRHTQMANCLQQTNVVTNDVINPSIQLRNRFSGLGIDENDTSDQNARDAVGNETEHTQATVQRSTQTSNRKQTLLQRKNVPLRQEEASAAECRETELGNSMHNAKDTEGKQLKNGNESRNKANTSTVIVGDSMTKHLDSRRLQRSVKAGQRKVFVETYRGAKSSDMKHHIKPCLTKKPTQVILHVGTNDLPQKQPSKIVEGIAEICDIIQTESPSTEIVISEIILRTDKAEYKQKIGETNSLLSNFCKSRNLYIIEHNNIGITHINSYGVHLNRAGTSVLARNISNYLNMHGKSIN